MGIGLFKQIGKDITRPYRSLPLAHMSEASSMRRSPVIQ